MFMVSDDKRQSYSDWVFSSNNILVLGLGSYVEPRDIVGTYSATLLLVPGESKNSPSSYPCVL